MNIFVRELIAYRKNLIIWSVSLVALLVSSMAKFTTLSAGGADAAKLFEQFPPAIRALFGMSGLDITTLIGYFGVLFLYVAIMMAIQAGLLGADILAKEEQDKTTEFLYVKPRSRGQIFIAKFAAALCLVALLNIVTFVSSVLLIKQYDGTPDNISILTLFHAAYLILQLLFLGVGMLFAAGRWSNHASKFITVAVFVSYLLYVVASMQPALRTICGISPLVQFEATNIIADQSLNLPAAITYVVVGVACFVLAYQLHLRRDVQI